MEQLWRYNEWANQTLIRSLMAYGKNVPGTCIRLLSHIVNAQQIWLSRIEGQPATAGVWEMHDLAACASFHQASSEGLQKKIEAHKNGMAPTVRYTNTKQETFQNSLQDILLHIFNHGTYHRAQIATEMRKNGLEPVNTDYITFVRQ